MKKVIILQGLPGSGKSTWAKELLSRNPGVYKRINKDELRSMLDNSHWSGGNEKFVLSVRDYLIKEALKDGKSVIVDDTNFHEKHEIRIKQIVDEYKKETGQVVAVSTRIFPIDLEEAIKRDLKRPNSVGEKVIRDMYDKYLKLVEKKVVMQQDQNLPHIIICDLDGTLCLHNNRGPYEYEKCDTDLENKAVADILRSKMDDVYSIFFLSGREDSVYSKTLEWILLHFPQIKCFSLVMRKTGDNRKDCIIKKEMFDEKIKDKFYVEFILDDRNQVVNMWREMGLTCLQVAEGNF